MRNHCYWVGLHPNVHLGAGKELVSYRSKGQISIQDASRARTPRLPEDED